MRSNRKDLNSLGRWALDTQLKPLRDMEPLIRPGRGWIKAIREAIGMTTGQFARRLGVSQPRVAALEKAEADGVVTLKRLRQAAEALDCDFVYALVPRKPLEQVVKDRARDIAERQLARTDQHWAAGAGFDQRDAPQDHCAHHLLAERGLGDEQRLYVLGVDLEGVRLADRHAVDERWPAR